MKHTPGPWEWVSYHDGDLNHLVQVGKKWPETVLEIGCMDDWHLHISEADAKLIEAAPDLLEAAIDLLTWLRENMHDLSTRVHRQDFADARRKLYRAASKATGRVVEEVKS